MFSEIYVITAPGTPLRLTPITGEIRTPGGKVMNGEKVEIMRENKRTGKFGLELISIPRVNDLKRHWIVREWHDIGWRRNRL